MVFAHDRLGIQPEYTSFLDSVIKDALLHAAVGDGKFCKLPLRITCLERKLKGGSRNSAENDETSYMKVDETLGYISIPVWESVPNIYKYIEQWGNEALQIRERLRRSEKHVDQVKLLVRRKLRLRELVFDKRLRIDMCLAALLACASFTMHQTMKLTWRAWRCVFQMSIDFLWKAPRIIYT
ncbi:hypothetical protein L7F22_011800 [Adiantum nelumboides]|nr:hypothetical protein [Adiantum nelumboides]